MSNTVMAIQAHPSFGVMASPPGPFDEVRQVVEQVECVVGISGNLCHRPHNQEEEDAFFVLDLPASQKMMANTQEEGKVNCLKGVKHYKCPSYRRQT